jgi:CRISPR-associated endonuclease Csn1
MAPRSQQLRQAAAGTRNPALACLKISFEVFSALSLKAIAPHRSLDAIGPRYDEAVAQIPEYGHHSQRLQPDVAKRLYPVTVLPGQRKYQVRILTV